MAFKNIKIVGDGTTQVTIVKDNLVESVINALVAYNSTSAELAFDMLIDGESVVNETVQANGSYRLVDKLNVQSNTELAINSPTGLDVTVSYFQQSIDGAQALTDAQNSSVNAKTSEDNAKVSEDNAKVSENNSKTSENNSKTSEDNAKISENASQSSEDDAELSEWRSEASSKTADSFASDDEDIITKIYTSNDDGTYSGENSGSYSSKHYSIKSANSAAEASDSESAASASANNKGSWSSLTGVLSVPASVNHNDEVWVLNEDVNDVTQEEPSVSTKWTEAGSSRQVKLNTKVVGTAMLDRHDKQLGSRDVIQMVYNSDDKLEVVRYSDDDDSNLYFRDVMSYNTGGKLIKVEHYNGRGDLTTTDGTTTLNYNSADKLVSTSYTE